MFFKNIKKKNRNVDKGGKGGGQPMWIIIKLYNIIIKSANVDNGGAETLIHKMWIKKSILLLLLKPSLSAFKCINPRSLNILTFTKFIILSLWKPCATPTSYILKQHTKITCYSKTNILKRFFKSAVGSQKYRL